MGQSLAALVRRHVDRPDPIPPLAPLLVTWKRERRRAVIRAAIGRVDGPRMAEIPRSRQMAVNMVER